MNEASVNMKDSIVKNLASNGFPMKKVSLPLEKLYESADKKGANLNDVLAELESNGTVHQKVGDKIIFSAEMPQNMSKEDMMKQAQDMMGKMDPEEMRKIQDMIANMSPEQQAEMMEQAKKMGLL